MKQNNIQNNFNCDTNWPDYDLDSSDNLKNYSASDFTSLIEENNFSSDNDGNASFSFGLPDVLFVLTYFKADSNKDINNLIAKLVVVREFQTVNMLELSKHLAFMEIEIMNIISIDKFNIVKTPSMISSCDTTCVVRYIEIGYDFFIENINNPDSQFSEYYKDTLYILRDGNYLGVKKLFGRINGIEVNFGKGTTQKSHVLSPIDFRLSFYLMAMLNFNYKYFSYLNTFNDIPKDRYLSYLDNSIRYKTSVNNNSLDKIPLNKRKFSTFKNRREYHTSSKNRTDNENVSTVFSYLDQIEGIINDSNSLFEAQKLIETSWIDLMKKKLEDPYISTWQMLPTLIKKSVNTLQKHEKRGILKRRFKLYSNEISNNKYEIVLLTMAMLISNYNKTSATNISIQIGKNIAFLLFKHTLLNSKSINIQNKFNEWKKNNDLDSNVKFLKLGDYFVNIFTNEPTQIFEFGLDDEGVIDTTSERIIKISPEYIDIVKETLIVDPTSLPMICEPLEWSDDSYGGFIENKFNQNTINTGSSYHGHWISQKDNLYKAINTLNKVKFNVNMDLLNYILNEGNYLLDDDSEKINFQNTLTIKVAKVYSKYDFYLNVNCDWRGRIYTNSFFLSYQGGDLSRSLINFSEGQKLTSEGLKYLYIFGANCYSNILSKKSFAQRITWVKNNITRIINLDKDFINLANKKIQFTSFCIALKNYELNNDSLIKLPVFLDATCSGMQHLAAMLKDINLGTQVNLLTKSEDEDVNDLYQTVIDPINVGINKFGKENPEHSSLEKVKLTREILKSSIMTQVYSVTVKGIYRQLINKLNKEKVVHPTEKTKNGKVKYNTFYHVPDRNGKEILLSYLDVYKIADIVKRESFNVYPSLKDIYNYFIDSVKLMLELSIPVIWFTPAGLEICQFYYTSKIEEIKLSFFGKTRTSVIREFKSIVDKEKQNQSIIPNIIHSLDVSHLINVINHGNDNNINPIICIHDCFGTHPNNMENLAKIVISEFVLLYTHHNFLEKYNERVINSIIDNNYEIIKKDGNKYVFSKIKLYLIPTVPKMGDLDLKKVIYAT